MRYVSPAECPSTPSEPRALYQAWGSKHAELFDSGRVTYHAQDFFDEHQPFEVPGVGKVSQPSVFLARAVAHNWPDKDVKVCVPSTIQSIIAVSEPICTYSILSILRRAAGPHTKLLWVDNLLPYACIDDKADLNSSSQGAVRSLVPEGSPLLPNLGKASANGYILDVSVSTHAQLNLLRRAQEI